jgi:hypothetical protein
MLFSSILWTLTPTLKFYAGRSPKLRDLIAKKNFIAQIQLKDGSRGRWYRFDQGRLTTGYRIHENPDVIVRFKSASIGTKVLVNLGSGMFHFAYPLLRPFLDRMDVINQAKNFAFEIVGDDELTLHFTDMLNTLLTYHSSGSPRLSSTTAMPGPGASRHAGNASRRRGARP